MAESAWLADLQWTVYLYKWLAVSCRSSAGQGKLAGQRPTFYHCNTQLNQDVIPEPTESDRSLPKNTKFIYTWHHCGTGFGGLA